MRDLRRMDGFGHRGRSAAGAVAVALAALAGCRTAAAPQEPEPATQRGGAVDPLRRAASALRAGRAAEAAAELLPVLERNPDSVRAHFLYQDAARLAGGDVERTMRERYASQAPAPSPLARWCRARLLGTAYERDQALRGLLSEPSVRAVTHLALARNQVAEGRLLPAVEAYQQALRADSALIEARRELAQVLAELGRSDEAVAEFEAYLASESDDELARRALLALLLYRLGAPGPAERQLDYLEARHPEDLDLWMDRAAALWLGGAPQRAAAKYLAVLERQPDAGRALLNVGLLCYEVLARDAASRQRYWPAARMAFALFLQSTASQDGYDLFERAVAVPFRLQRIQQLLGPAVAETATLRDLIAAIGGQDAPRSSASGQAGQAAQ